MRTEREIIDNIIGVAVKDESVRAVIRTDLLPVREYLEFPRSFYLMYKINPSC